MFNTLLVEDDVSYRKILSDVLLLHFPLIGVDEAGDGMEALSKVECQRPDLIFMGNQLPGENGMDVTKKIKRMYDDIVIVILSTNNLPEHRQQAFRNGADYFLSKEDDFYMEKYRVLTYQLTGNYFTGILSEQRQRTQAKLNGGYINVQHPTC